MMKKYCINYITGNGKGEEIIKAPNKKIAKLLFKIKHKKHQIVSVWIYYTLDDFIDKKVVKDAVDDGTEYKIIL